MTNLVRPPAMQASTGMNERALIYVAARRRAISARGKK